MAIEVSSEMDLILDFEGQVARNHLKIKSEVSRKEGSQGSTTEGLRCSPRWGRPQKVRPGAAGVRTLRCLLGIQREIPSRKSDLQVWRLGEGSGGICWQDIGMLVFMIMVS